MALFVRSAFFAGQLSRAPAGVRLTDRGPSQALIKVKTKGNFTGRAEAAAVHAAGLQGLRWWQRNRKTCAPRRASRAVGLWKPSDSIQPENTLMGKLAFVLGLLAVWFECRHADCFSL